MIFNMQTRILSAIILAPLFIISIMLSSTFFIWVIGFVAILMLFEWYDMTESSTKHLLAGLPVILAPVLSLIHIRLMKDGHYAILIYFSMVWAVDIFAMLGGKKLGGIRLAPTISPKKTWSGLFCGMIACAITLEILSTALPSFPLPFQGYKLLCFGLAFGIIEQCSDLLISYFKRRFHIKDSGIIIPGHGGVLDRFDGIILTAPLLLWLIT